LSNNKRIYVTGALLGVLAIVSALATTYLMGRTNYLGTSTTFVRAAGFIEQFFSPETTSSLSYYVSTNIKVDWQFMLVIGIAIGSFISSVTSNRNTNKSHTVRKSKRRFSDRGTEITEGKRHLFMS